MSDPVDTDTLRRDARVLSPGFPGVEKRLNAAADEVDRLRKESAFWIEQSDIWKRIAQDERTVTDRLRKAIEDAPHEEDCRTRLPKNWENRRCDCWKADAL